jgi:hypothetical protein
VTTDDWAVTKMKEKIKQVNNLQNKKLSTEPNALDKFLFKSPEKFLSFIDPQ